MPQCCAQLRLSSSSSSSVRSSAATARRGGRRRGGCGSLVVLAAAKGRNTSKKRDAARDGKATDLKPATLLVRRHSAGRALPRLSAKSAPHRTPLEPLSRSMEKHQQRPSLTDNHTPPSLPPSSPTLPPSFPPTLTGRGGGPPVRAVLLRPGHHGRDSSTLTLVPHFSAQLEYFVIMG